MMKSYRLSLGSFLAALLFPLLSANAQIVVDQTLTVEQLVNEIILGEGVIATNITFNGMPGNTVSLQLGSFTAFNTNFPIEEGLVMATANSQIMVPGGAAGTVGDLQNDPDLLAIGGEDVGSIRNAAIIEFDFTVESDSVVFDYIFASAEYTDYTCCTFNDVFGFFLSGPGINGPFTNNAENIALIPDTDIPVGVNTVNSAVENPQSFCFDAENCLAVNPNYVEDSQYFINNQQSNNSISTSLNGHTTTLKARYQIECGGTYRIKLAIGNANDPLFQSAVFLRKGSFSAAGTVFVNVQPSLPGVNLEGSGFENVVVAGCFSPLVELVRPEGAPLGTISVEYGGTAIEGIDYILGENDTLFAFSEGVDTLRFNITTFPNSAAADTVFLDFFVIYEACGGPDTVTASIPIIQPYSISSATENVTVICPADSTVVTAQGLGGVGPYTFNWIDQIPGEFSLVPVPPDQFWYVVEINDQCDFERIRDSVLVVNNIPPPLTVNIPTTAQPLCPTMPVQIFAQVTDGNPPYFYDWGPVEGFIDNIIVEFPESTDVFITITDSCGTVVTDTMNVRYPVYENISLTLDVTKNTCPENPLRIAVLAENGAGNYSYVWAEEEGNGSFENAGADITTFMPDPGFSYLEVTVRDQCFSLVSNPFLMPYMSFASAEDTMKTIDLRKVPNVITPNNDGRNDIFAVPGLDIFENTAFDVWDRWGTSIFTSTDYRIAAPGIGRSAAFDGGDQPDGSYFFVLNVNSGECVKTGYLQILGSNPPRVGR